MIIAMNRQTKQVAHPYIHSEKVIKYLKGGIPQWSGYTGFNADWGDTGYNILPWKILKRGGVSPLKFGATGSVVAYLQGLLTATGHVPSSNDTQVGKEIFGASTYQMVQDFQTQAGLTPVDGIVGSATWDALEATASQMNATVATPSFLTEVENVFNPTTAPTTPAPTISTVTTPVATTTATSKIMTYTLIGGGILGAAILIMKMMNK